MLQRAATPTREGPPRQGGGSSEACGPRQASTERGGVPIPGRQPSRPSLWPPLPTSAAEGSPEPLIRREHTARATSRPRPAHPWPRSSCVCSAAQALEASRRLEHPVGAAPLLLWAPQTTWHLCTVCARGAKDSIAGATYPSPVCTGSCQVCSPVLCRLSPAQVPPSLPPPPRCTLAWRAPSSWNISSSSWECSHKRMMTPSATASTCRVSQETPAPAQGCSVPRPTSVQASSVSQAQDPVGSMSSVARQERPQPLPLSGHPAHCHYLNPKCPH